MTPTSMMSKGKKQGRTFFDYSLKEKKEIILNAGKESAKEMRKMIKKYEAMKKDKSMPPISLGVASPLGDGWEERFDKVFFDNGYHESNGIEVLAEGRHKCNEKCKPRVFVNFSKEKVKDFIRSTLQKERQKVLEEVRKCLPKRKTEKHICLHCGKYVTCSMAKNTVYDLHCCLYNMFKETK